MEIEEGEKEKDIQKQIKVLKLWWIHLAEQEEQDDCKMRKDGKGRKRNEDIEEGNKNKRYEETSQKS